MTTSMGVTTATASVMPAARPARVEERLSDVEAGSKNPRSSYVLTEEGCLTADGTSIFIGQLLLVPFVGSKPNCHFRYDPCDHGPKSFIKTQRSFSFDDFCAGSEEAPTFSLSGSQLLLTALPEQGLTPGARARLESCIRTLIVSFSHLSGFF